MIDQEYRKLLREVYIDSLRSVLIVDDDFPTLDDILEKDFELSEKSIRKSWFRDRETIQKIFKQFREVNSPFILDVDDGRAILEKSKDRFFANHFHQTDLLVLDYILDSTTNSGEKALRIIRQLARNPHFNIVVINTKEDVSNVFSDVLLSLMTPNEFFQDAPVQTLTLAQENLDEVGIPWSDLEDIVVSDPSLYIEARQIREKDPETDYLKSQIFAPFLEKMKKSKISDSDSIVILKHLCKEFENLNKQKLNPEQANEPKYSEVTTTTKWIKTDNLFIAFASKSDENGLLKIAEDALCAWNPNPARMILSKIRTEVGKNGVTVQDEVLSAKYASALWFKLALKAKLDDRTVKIEELIKRQAEMLFSKISPNIIDYTRRLLEAEDIGEEDNEQVLAEICKKHFSVDFSDGETHKTAINEHNFHISNKEPEGWHLQTGHIVKIDEVYWVCLSPSCDLIPRMQPDRVERYGENIMPFLAVKLQLASENSKSKSTDGRFVHLTIQDTVTRFAINKPEHYASGQLWHTLFAHDLGKFDPQKKEIEISHLAGENNGLVVKKSNAQIVGHLRYEYALSLSQQFSKFISRIGLDFLSL